MLKVVENRTLLTITLPRRWVAEDLAECRFVEKAMAKDTISEVTVDLSQVEVLNPATIWLIDQLQWNCVNNRKTFNIIAASKICELYFSLIPAAI